VRSADPGQSNRLRRTYRGALAEHGTPRHDRGLSWPVDELGIPSGGRPVYAMNSIEQGLALHSFLGHTGLPSAQTPAASEPRDAPGAFGPGNGSGGHRVHRLWRTCRPFTRRHLRHGLRNGGCRHDVQP
jgi:hypothetical protein